eukprot:1983362-Pyramimonas_sp.AAC.1
MATEEADDEATAVPNHHSRSLLSLVDLFFAVAELKNVLSIAYLMVEPTVTTSCVQWLSVWFSPRPGIAGARRTSEATRGRGIHGDLRRGMTFGAY